MNLILSELDVKAISFVLYNGHLDENDEEKREIVGVKILFLDGFCTQYDLRIVFLDFWILLKT